LIATFVHLEKRDPGFRPDHLLTFNVGLGDGRYKVAQQIDFSDRLLARLRAVPGVRNAAWGMPLPLAGHQMSVSFEGEERPSPPDQRPRADISIVTPGYFEAMGIPILHGRDFTERDDAAGRQVMIVNEAFAKKFFPGQDAIGKRIKSGATNGKAGVVARPII